MTRAIALSDFELARFLFALLTLLASAHFFGYLFQRIGLTRIVGEIFAGLILGPTCLGALAPSMSRSIYFAFSEEAKLIAAIYAVGLVLLMFIAGFEVRGKVQGEDRRTIWGLLIGSTIPPFAVAWILAASYDLTCLMGPAGNIQALRLIVAIAVSITSIPFISKIFLDLNILGTRFARVVLTAATVHDVALWVALSVATTLTIGAAITPWLIMRHLLITLFFFAAALLLMPKLVERVAGLRVNLIAKSSPYAYVTAIILLFATVASHFEVNIIFGAFLAGIVVGRLDGESFAEVRSQIRSVAQSIFIPIYFAVVGLKIDLLHHFDPVVFLAFLAISSAIAMTGAVAGGRAVGKDWLTSFNLAIAMNARGGPGIVLATIAFDLGIINESFFVTLVLTAILTSLAAGAWFRQVLRRGWELYR